MLSAAEAVAASLTSLTAHQLGVVGVRWEERAEQWLVIFGADGTPVEVYALGSGPAQDAMAMLNSLTDDLAERFWGEPIPPCPGHHHPMRPTLIAASDEVHWICPVTCEVVAVLWPPSSHP